MKDYLAKFLKLVLACMLLAWPIMSAQAAVLSGRSVVVTRQQTNTATDFEIHFTTPTGVDSSTDTIILTFPSGYSMGSVAFGDIDLSHGASTGLETSETLAAAAAAGAWGVAVSGQQITFSAPSDAAVGEITAAHLVVIKIGQNASGGTNRITNPSSTGNASLLVGGTFGDVGGMDLFITSTSTDALAVTATIPSSAGGGSVGGAGGTGGDGSAPVIANVVARNITTSTVEITWTTDEPADSGVNYGLTSAYERGSVTSPEFVTSHSVTLSGLSPDTLYHFQVTSADAVRNGAASVDYQFRTHPPPHPPVISGTRAVSITDSSAVVLWSTDIPATGAVDFGPTSAYGESLSGDGLSTDHAIYLTGLSAGATYHFRVRSSEETGLTTTSGDYTFTTTNDLTAPANVYGFTATPGNAIVRLDWVNPTEPDFSYVKIVARTDRYPTTPSDGRLVFQGSGTTYPDMGLVNGTTYYYANFAYDATGNRSSGAYASAAPLASLPDEIPPIPPPEPIPTPEPTPTPVPTPTPTPTPTPSPLPEPTPTPSPAPSPEPAPAPITPSEENPTPLPIGPDGEPIFPVPVPGNDLPRRSGVVSSPTYYGSGGAVELQPDARGTLGIIAGTSVTARLPVVGLGGIPTQATITIGRSAYGLAPSADGTSLGATFVPSRIPAIVPAAVSVIYPDGTSAIFKILIAAVSPGRIFGKDTPLSKAKPLSGAKVSLYDSRGRLWNGALFGQPNPKIASDDGYYSFTVPNGTYRLVVERAGFVSQEKTIRVTRNVIAENFTLPGSLGLLDVLQTTKSKEIANAAAPVIIALAVANEASSAWSLATLFNYLRMLFSQPLLLINRRRREKYGVVYNSLTKMPIDLVAVRLVHVKSGLIVQSAVSDGKGRFVMRAAPGAYRLEARKAGYIFPSQVLKDDRGDVEFLDLYHGERIEVKEDTHISPNIPLDPDVKEETPRRIIWKTRLHKLQAATGSLSVWLSLAVFAIAPSVLTGELLALQIVIYAIFRRFSKPKKPTNWGIVYDETSKKPLRRAIVRIFDKKSNKLLEMQLTDAKGKYGFLVGKNVYFVTSEAMAYSPYKSQDIDLTQVEKGTLDRSIGLTKAGDM